MTRDVRIVSLVPAGTEIAWALGLEERLVAVTHDCDFPPSVRTLPRVTSSTIPPGSTSREIDHLVRSAGERGESTFHVDAGALREARPDVIVGQTICRVCAVTLDQLPAQIGSAPRTIPLTGESIDGVFADIQRVADGLGARERGERVVSDLHARLYAIGARVAGRARPRVACVEWLDPLFKGGHWVPEQVAYAGGIDVLGTPGERGLMVEWSEVLAARPEVLVLMPCGFDTARAVEEASAVTDRAGFADLPAARSDRVFATNGSAYFSRPGPRLVDGVEILAALLHPDVFPPPRAEDAVRVPLAARRTEGGFAELDLPSPLDAAIERVMATHVDLASDVRAGRSKAWGKLAALGVVAYREILGRPLTDRERREVWSHLWRAAAGTGVSG